ncbi:unnamed protein product [Phytomonas sp. Hart1]|nr:unnamed protein product [Phytomonas sp. Hart1]|eukprot:CCW71348.1 unnamed protein product [Phytomonas sp. isolate Hart1]
MSFTDRLKTYVSRSVGGAVGNSLITSAKTPEASFSHAFGQTKQLVNTLFVQKEWQCPCGHKFRAAGEWVACAPIYCEVPSCPNPKYYIDGPGRILLESNPSGIRLEEVKNRLEPTNSDTKQPKGVASRFK